MSKIVAVGFQYFNSFLVGGDFSCLLILFAKSLIPDQDGQNVGPDLDPNRLTHC